MNRRQRMRRTGRGRERSLWLLVAAVLFAVLGAVVMAIALMLEWPAWARAVPAGLAALAALAVPELRARFKQDDELAALVARASAVPITEGRLPQVQDVSLLELGVHAVRVPMPYVKREVQPDVAKTVHPGRAVLLVGHSMAGKTRLASQVVQHKYSEHPLLVAESGQALQALVTASWDPAGVVVWLDNLERFLGADGLTVGVLEDLINGRAIVIGTIRSTVVDTYRPGNDLRLPEWEVIQRFTRIDLKRRLSPTERTWVQERVSDPKILAAVDQHGLAEYLGAGPEAIDKFINGDVTHPVGHALVRAAVDWRRTGLKHPIPRTVLISPAVLASYLAERPDVLRTDQALDEGLDWATKKINETVALLSPLLTDPVQPAFEAFDYLVDHVTLSGLAIPDPMWHVSLREATPTEWNDVAHAAYNHKESPGAELALGKAAAAGDHAAMFYLGVLLAERGELAEAETWYRKAAAAGDSEEMNKLGALLEQRGELAEAKDWFRKADAATAWR